MPSGTVIFVFFCMESEDFSRHNQLLTFLKNLIPSGDTSLSESTFVKPCA